MLSTSQNLMLEMGFGMWVILLKRVPVSIGSDKHELWKHIERIVLIFYINLLKDSLEKREKKLIKSYSL